MASNHQQAASIGFFVCFCCCLLCCAIPGMSGLMVLSDAFAHYEVTTGTVVDRIWCSDSTSTSSSSSSSSSSSYRGSTKTQTQSNEATYHILYNFTTTDGKAVTGLTSYCTNAVPSIGTTETIMYDPDDPEGEVWQEYFYDMLGSVFRGLAGVGWAAVIISCCLGVYMLVNKPNQNNNNNTNQYPVTATPHTPVAGTTQQNTAYATATPTGPAGDYPTGSSGDGGFANALGPPPGGSNPESTWGSPEPSSPPIVYASNASSAPMASSTPGPVTYYGTSASAPSASQPLVYTGGPVTNYKP